MRILVIYNNQYGERFVSHFLSHTPEGWMVAGYEFTGLLPAVIDDPCDHLPSNLPQTDLLIYLGQDRRLAELLSDLAEATGAKEVIAPVDARGFLPAGLANQISKRLKSRGIPIVLPAPFCSLEEKEQLGPLTREFARQFGKPRLDVQVQNGRIAAIAVRRGAPCGNTHFLAEKTIGISVEAIIEEVGRQFHAHPCMASMEMDRELNDTILHVAGHLAMDAMKEQIKEELVE